VSLDEGDTRFVIAADAGGTYSRVGCYGLDGRLLGFATGKGGSPYHQADAVDNVADTTTRALRAGGLDASHAVVLVAGLAMVSPSGSNQGDGDNSWARDDPAFTARLADALAEKPATSAVLVPSELEPLGGAAVIAYQHAGIALDDQLVRRLRDSQADPNRWGGT
jgi:2-keto-3-deoxy-galactonokinase